ncbi:MAG: RHS repeat-associated core domain-containing protein [Pirellulales bacterium]
MKIGQTVTTSTNGYDPLGQRTSSTEANGTTVHNFLVAPAAQRLGAGPLDVSVQHLATDGSGGVQAGWVYAGENPILRFDSSNNVEYYLEDAGDSIAALVDSSGVATAEYAYDGFGILLDGYLPPTSDAGGDFGFHAAWLDPDTGLYDMRARSYDPETGRFTAPDPAEPNPQAPETYRPYTFANNNPRLYSDPTGAFSIAEINVTEAIQGQLRNLQTAVINEVKERVHDEVFDFAIDQIFKAMLPWVPMDLSNLAKGPNPIAAINEGNNFDFGLTKGICGLLKANLDDAFWLQVGIDKTGDPYDDGISCEGLHIRLGGNRPRPDYVISQTTPTETSSSARAYLVGDIKRSTTTLYNSYVRGSQRTQWEAITNFAETRGFRAVMFITLFHTGKTEDALERLAERTGLTEGLLIQIISIR